MGHDDIKNLAGYLAGGLVGIALHAASDDPWWMDMIVWTVISVATWTVLGLIGWLGRWQRRRKTW